ncbi:MAG: ion transporter, partial [Rubrimonas sp.]
MRDALRGFIETPLFQNAILTVILINAVALGLETSATVMAHAGGLIRAIDAICLTIFITEIAAKLVARRWRFFGQAWNLFDMFVVGVSLVPGGESLTALRALRVLRLFRVISVAPRLRRVVEGFVRSLPGMGSVFLLMAMIFYIGSVMATNLFGRSFPDWFGDIGNSAYSLFQIMTLESWSMGIVRPVMEVHPWAWAFFVPFILLTTFAVVNLLVGLVVNSMQEAHSEEQNAETDAYRTKVLEGIAEIRARLDAL